jgi:hypothetical protein
MTHTLGYVYREVNRHITHRLLLDSGSLVKLISPRFAIAIGAELFEAKVRWEIKLVNDQQSRLELQSFYRVNVSGIKAAC